MRHPPTRADEVRMMSSSQGGKLPPRQAAMTALDLEDGSVRPDSWFAYVLPVQMGVQMMGSGRYGYWDQQPRVSVNGDCIFITGHEDSAGSEPILVVPRSTAISVMVAQAKHVDATPFPTPQVESGN